MKKLTLALLLVCAVWVICPQGIGAEEFKVGGTYILASAPSNMQIAELTLSQIADRDGTSRKITGYSLIAGGVGITVLGTLIDEPDALPVFIVLGGVVAGSGALVLALPSDSEREYKKVLQVTEPEEREYRAEQSLAYLADKAHRNRIISAASNGAMAIYYLYKFSKKEDPFNNDDTDSEGKEIYYAIGMAGSAIYQLMVPTYVEKAYKEVQEAKAAKVSFQIGKFTGLVASVNF